MLQCCSNDFTRRLLLYSLTMLLPPRYCATCWVCRKYDTTRMLLATSVLPHQDCTIIMHHLHKYAPYHYSTIISIICMPSCQHITGAIPQYSNYVPMICAQPHCGMYYFKLKILLARTPPYQPYTNSASNRQLNNFRDRISCSPLYNSAILFKH